MSGNGGSMRKQPKLRAGCGLPPICMLPCCGPSRCGSATDAALASFEAELAALRSSTDAEILAVVQRLVLALNKINEQHVRAGLIGYETDEREELCEYITESLRRFGIDVKGLEQRNGAGPGDIAGRWRDW
jgi:hypothetical protein